MAIVSDPAHSYTISGSSSAPAAAATMISRAVNKSTHAIESFGRDCSSGGGGGGSSGVQDNLQKRMRALPA
uniref:Uncharacterized protein n=1 Tax=Trichogramma kaykai TaxID=54128 RepID=A0ABD2XBJ3_9HYME